MTLDDLAQMMGMGNEKEASMDCGGKKGGKGSMMNEGDMGGMYGKGTVKPKGKKGKKKGKK